jgi:hypothetical protein
MSLSNNDHVCPVCGQPMRLLTTILLCQPHRVCRIGGDRRCSLGWLALARSYELQQRLSTMLHEHENSNATASIARMPRGSGRAFDPEVVAIMASAFRAVFADLGLSHLDDEIALRAALLKQRNKRKAPRRRHKAILPSYPQ